MYKEVGGSAAKANEFYRNDIDSTHAINKTNVEYQGVNNNTDEEEDQSLEEEHLQSLKCVPPSCRHCLYLFY